MDTTSLSDHEIEETKRITTGMTLALVALTVILVFLSSCGRQINQQGMDTLREHNRHQEAILENTIRREQQLLKN